MPWEKVNPVIDLSVRDLCYQPYVGHPKGCPNYNHKSGCPPSCPSIMQMLDLSQPVYAIWNQFDFAAHCERMRRKHSDWSKRQIQCCRYWQPTVRKVLKQEVKRFLINHDSFIVCNSPEANGVNVTETMKEIGVFLEWPPEQFTYQVALAGERNGN